MNKYIVALLTGGIMESPEINYVNYQIVKADTKKKAVEIYNETNKCDYFYGDVVGGFQQNEWKILDNKITKQSLESFLRTLKKEVYE